MKAKLKMVELAYDEHACLHFRVNVNRAEAARAARIIRQHNDFQAENVIQFLRLLKPKTRLEIGREYSPVLYVYPRNGFFQKGEKAELLAKAQAAELRADEIDLGDSDIYFRIWWD